MRILPLFLLGLSPALMAFAAPATETFVDSLPALAEQAGRSGVHVRMKPGTYRLADPALARTVTVTTPAEGGRPEAAYRVNTLIHFSGRDSVFNLTGVVIQVDTAAIHQGVRGPHDKILVSGERLVIRGLEVQDQGSTPPDRHGLRMMHVIGNGNRIENVSLAPRGSSPYGYGNLLGKGGGNALVPLHKQSCLLITGRGNRIIGARVTARVFGHGIVMQGAVDTHIEGCHVEGELRATDDMLKETSGPAHGVGFRSDYPPGRIVPGVMVALSEDGIRAYASGRQVGGRRTAGVTVTGCTIRDMRSGVSLGEAGGKIVVRGCLSTGHTEKGYCVPSGAVVEDCAGDARFAPLLGLYDARSRDCRIEVTLIGTTGAFAPLRAAEINGIGHRITLKLMPGSAPQRELPIVFGPSFWADVHHFRDPATAYDSWTGAQGIELRNETSLPVVFGPTARDCVVRSAGGVARDEGRNNRILKLAE